MEVLLIVFFYCNGIEHHEFLSQDRMVNKEYYLKVIRQLPKAIRQKRTELRKNQSWILNYDNAPAQTSMLVREFFWPKTLFPLSKTKDTHERKAFCYD